MGKNFYQLSIAICKVVYYTKRNSGKGSGEIGVVITPKGEKNVLHLKAKGKGLKLDRKVYR